MSSNILQKGCALRTFAEPFLIIPVVGGIICQWLSSVFRNAYDAELKCLMGIAVNTISLGNKT